LGPEQLGVPRTGTVVGPGSRNRAGKRRGRRAAIDGLKLAYDEVAGGTGDINRLVRAIGEEKDARGWIDEGDVEGCPRFVYISGAIWSRRVGRQTDDAGDLESIVVGGPRHGNPPRGKRDPEASDGLAVYVH
jgi:hypothetical protein